MSTGYYALVIDGVVDSVIVAGPEFIAENPVLPPSIWVEVTDMDNFPAPGWTWTESGGFVDPTAVEPIPVDPEVVILE